LAEVEVGFDRAISLCEHPFYLSLNVVYKRDANTSEMRAPPASRTFAHIYLNNATR